MTTYWLTYRIKEDASGRVRRDLLNNIVTLMATGATWDEPTSFLMFDATDSFKSVALQIEKVIDPREDVVLLSTLGGSPMVMIGHTDHLREIRHLNPNVLPLKS